MNLREKIKNLIEKEIEKMGYQLKGVEIKEKKRAKEVIITVDKKGGITVEDCAKISNQIDPILEKENLFKSRWYLIVSSPGI